jgi:hypothetical protein
MEESLRPRAVAPRALGAAALACLAGFSGARLHAAWPSAPLADAASKRAAPSVEASAKLRAKAHVEAARTKTLAALSAKGLELPRDFLQWVDGDPLVRASVYGCRADPLPVLLGLRALELDLGTKVVRREATQLALAFAIQDSYAGRAEEAGGWNDADKVHPPTLPDLAPRKPTTLAIPGDPRRPVDAKDRSRALDRDDHIVNFLEDHEPIEVERPAQELPPLDYDERGVAKQRKAGAESTKERRGLVAADVIASAALQAEFNAYMAAKGHPETRVDCGERAVHWMSKAAIDDKDLRARIAAAHELFRDAYRRKGRLPARRDRAPTAAESMAWFLRNDRLPPTEAERAGRKGERFPLDAPWPVLLMLAADDQPLREREEIWSRLCERGEFRTYGEYIDGIAQQFDMQSARRLAPFAYDYGSIQMMWKDGGVCGTMGNIGARTWRIAGTPASTAGQPGHCAVVVMRHDPATGEFRCEGEQYATGGDEVTTVHAGWNHDDQGGRRPMVHHQSVCWAVNHGFASFLDAMALRRAHDASTGEQRAQGAVQLVRDGLELNPWALVLPEAAVRDASDARALIGVVDALQEGLEQLGKLEEHPLYAATVRDMAHARIHALPSPATEEERTLLLEALERQGCTHAELLARLWKETGGAEGFAAHCRAAVGDYLSSPARGRSKRESERFLARIKAWEKAAGGGTRKKAWAQDLLAAFDGREQLAIGGKSSLDPCVAHLRKLAGVEDPRAGG